MMAGALATLRSGFRSDFVRSVAATFGTRIGLVLAGVVTSVLIARSLGPDGRGALAIAAAVTAVAIQLGNLGLHSSNTWAVAREPNLLSALIANSLVVGLSLGTVLIAVVVAIASLFPQAIPVGGDLLGVALIGIPLGLISLLAQNLLLGLHRVRDYNLLEIAARVGAIVTTAGLILSSLATPITVLLGGTLVSIVIVVVMVRRLIRLTADPVRPRFDLLRTYGAFGLKAYWTALISFLVIRVDVFLVEAFRGFEGVGQYTIAVALADLLYSLPIVIGTLLFPRLSAVESPRARAVIARDVAVRVAAIMTASGLAAVVLAEPAIRLLYGDDFLPAVGPFIWLVPGIVALSTHTILMNYFASAGLPLAVTISPLIGLGANVALNLALIPSMGLIGASLASTASYGMMLVISGGFFRRALRQLAVNGEQ